MGANYTRHLPATVTPEGAPIVITVWGTVFGPRRTCYAEAPATLLGVLETAFEEHGRPEGTLRITVGDEVVDEKENAELELRSGDVVHVRVVPELIAILSAIATYVTVAVTAIAEIFFAFETAVIIGEVAGAIAALATVAGAGYAVYAYSKSFTGGQTPRLAGGSVGGGTTESSSGRPKSDSPTISGARNAERPWDPIAKVYGKFRNRPPIIGRQYTEIIGGKMYLRVLFLLGYGPLRVSDIKVGETPLFVSGYEQVVGGRQGPLNGPNTNNPESNFAGVEYQILEGWRDDPHVSLYPSNVAQQPLAARIHRNKANGATGWSVATTATQTGEIQMSFSFPGGFVVYNDINEKQNDVRMKFRFEYQEQGGDWSDPIVPPRNGFQVHKKDGGANRTGAGRFEVKPQEGQFFIGVSFRTDDPTKQWDVRVRIADGGAPQRGGPLSAAVVWTALTSIDTESPVVGMEGLSMLALKIQASNKLSGQVDTLSCITEAYLPYYTPAPFNVWSDDVDGNHWPPYVSAKEQSWRITRNAAWAFADVLRGGAQGESIGDEFIDGDKLYAWATANEAEGRNFDAIVDFAGATYNLLKDIAATARASPNISGEWKIGVVYDRDTRAEAPVALITPRNSLAGNFTGELEFPDVPEIVRVRFVSEEAGYELDEISVPRPGFIQVPAVATRVEEDEIWGVTDADTVWRIVRRKLAENVYRKERFTIAQDLEYLAVERGDLVAFGHDVPLLGVSYGRVVTANTTTVVVDESVEFQGDASYSVSFRGLDGVRSGALSRALVNPALSGEVRETNVLTLETALDPADVPEPESIFTFGQSGLEFRRCVVHSVRPRTDMTAVLTLIDEGDEVWDAEGGDSPPYDPGITPPTDAAPYPPTIDSIVNDTPEGAIRLHISPSSGGPVPPSWWEVQWRLTVPSEEDDDSSWVELQPERVNGATVVYIRGVVDGQFYDVRVRSLGGTLNGGSAWVYVNDWLYTGPTIYADAFQVTGLELAGLGSSKSFPGTQPSYEWRLSSPLYTPDPILDPTGLSGVGNAPDVEDSNNPYFQDYEIVVVDPFDPESSVDNPVRRTHVGSRSWTYRVQDQIADANKRQPPYDRRMRTLDVGVAFRDHQSRVGPIAWFLGATNPAPIISAWELGHSQGTLWADVQTVIENDIAGYRMYATTDLVSPEADIPLNGTTQVVDSSSNNIIWKEAPKGTYRIFIVAYDEFVTPGWTDARAEGLNPTPSQTLTTLGPGIAADVVIPLTDIIAVSANSVTLAGAPFDVDEYPDDKVVGAYAKVDVTDGDLFTNATGKVRIITGWSPSTGEVFLSGSWGDRTPSASGRDKLVVYRADIDDGVLNEIHVGHATIGVLELLEGSVSTGGYSAVVLADVKPNFEKYASGADVDVALTGNERVMIQASVSTVNTDAPNDELAFSQLLVGRELAGGILPTPVNIQRHDCESLDGWAAQAGTIQLSTTRTEGNFSVQVSFSSFAAGATLTLDPDEGLHFRDTPSFKASLRPSGGTLDFVSVSFFSSAASSPVKTFNFSTLEVPENVFTEIDIDLKNDTPDSESGSWNGDDVFRINFTAFYTAGDCNLNIDDVNWRRENSDDRIVVGGGLEPGEFVPSSGYPTFVVLRPNGPVELSSATVSMEMVREIISNDQGSIEIGVTDTEFFTNDDLAGGNAQPGNAFFVYQAVEFQKAAAIDDDVLSLWSHDDEAEGSQTTDSELATNYRVLARRRLRDKGLRYDGSRILAVKLKK